MNQQCQQCCRYLDGSSLWENTGHLHDGRLAPPDKIQPLALQWNAELFLVSIEQRMQALYAITTYIKLALEGLCCARLTDSQHQLASHVITITMLPLELLLAT